MCDCGLDIETTEHFFLRCQFFANERQILFEKLYLIDSSIKDLNEASLLSILLYGSENFNDQANKEILLHLIDYVKSTKRFERPLIDHC